MADETVRPAWLTDAVIEAAARAIYEFRGGDWDALSYKKHWHAAARAALLAAAPFVREGIAAGLDDEASMTPCAEDALIVRDCAALIRADFSHEEAERAAEAAAPPATEHPTP